jgi:hypothetical protein
MAKKQVLGVFKTADNAVMAVDRLQESGFTNRDWTVLTGSPYPEGAFGEWMPKHRLYAFPFMGAIVGFSMAILVTAGTSVANPLVTGGKPIIAIPAMSVIVYEGTMLGAILMTIIGVIFESRLPRPLMGLYDERITEGYIGLDLNCPEDRVNAAEMVMRQSGAVDVKHQK